MDDDLEDEEEEAEIDDVEDIEGEDGVAAGNVNGSDDDEEEEEMSNPPMGSNHGAILNVSAVADALANNPAEAAKLLEQHQQLDKRQRQQFLMQGRDIRIYYKGYISTINRNVLPYGVLSFILSNCVFLISAANSQQKSLAIYIFFVNFCILLTLNQAVHALTTCTTAKGSKS